MNRSWRHSEMFTAHRCTDEVGGRRPMARLCQLHRWIDFPGYGFNLLAMKGRRGHYVQNVERGSPAETGGIKVGDRIVEVNGVNIFGENHQQVTAAALSVGTHYRFDCLCFLVSFLYCHLTRNYRKSI